MQWFRFYSEFAHDPKILRLPVEVRYHFVMLLCMHSADFLPTFDREISLFLQISEKKWEKSKGILLKDELITENRNVNPAIIDIKNWEKRQYKSDSSTVRMRKYREKKMTNVTVSDETCDGSGDGPEQSRTEQNRINTSSEFLSSATKGTKKQKISYQTIVELYDKHLGKIATSVIELSDARKTFIRARYKKELPTLEAWDRYFRRVSKSDFLTGRTEKPFYADFDWLLKQSNCIKVLEDKYSNQRR